MSLSEFDAYRPENEPRRKQKRNRPPGRGRRRGGGDGTREMPMVDDVEFSDSYYGRAIVKAPPWDYKISAYLFLGGVAGGSALLAAGADDQQPPARFAAQRRVPALLDAAAA